MMSAEKANCSVHFHVTERDLEALNQLANAEGRSRSNLIAWVLHNHLVRAGYIKAEKRNLIG